MLYYIICVKFSLKIIREVIHLNTFWLIPLVIFAWILQYALTFLQVRHYRSAMNELIEQYRGMASLHLFSGSAAKKAWGSGAMVLVVVDEQYEVRKCLILSGYTVFSRFKHFKEYEKRHVGELLRDAHETLTEKTRVSTKDKSLAFAFKAAAENALLTISSKKRTSSDDIVDTHHG